MAECHGRHQCQCSSHGKSQNQRRGQCRSQSQCQCQEQRQRQCRVSVRVTILLVGRHGPTIRDLTSPSPIALSLTIPSTRPYRHSVEGVMDARGKSMVSGWRVELFQLYPIYLHRLSCTFINLYISTCTTIHSKLSNLKTLHVDVRHTQAHTRIVITRAPEHPQILEFDA